MALTHKTFIPHPGNPTYEVHELVELGTTKEQILDAGTNFISAIKYMMAQVKIAGYTIDEPTLYSDNVMVFGKKKDDENVK